MFTTFKFFLFSLNCHVHTQVPEHKIGFKSLFKGDAFEMPLQKHNRCIVKVSAMLSVYTQPSVNCLYKYELTVITFYVTKVDLS